jgi:hypothetical protein
MRIVKLTNGNVVLTDAVGTEVLKRFSIDSFVEAVGDDSINIHSLNKMFSIKVADITATAIDPAPDVPFVGDADDLVNLLSTSFFINTAASGTLPAGAATEAQQELANFMSIPGNSGVVEYYSGVAAGNPSGNTENIKTIAYLTGITPVYTRTYTYDANDNLLTITVS